MEKETIIHFLAQIGIAVIETDLPDNCFLPGLQLKGSSILMDPKKMKYLGDLLHEAGHIAVTEAHLRPLIGSSEMDPEWPSAGDEIVTMLWSIAALRHLALPTNFVFHSEGYKGQADWLVESFDNGTYIGLPLLEWMGLCNGPEKATKEGTVAFPHMLKWMR